jgi:hypothetical protein
MQQARSWRASDKKKKKKAKRPRQNATFRCPHPGDGDAFDVCCTTRVIPSHAPTPTLQRQRSLLRRRLLPEPQHEGRTTWTTLVTPSHAPTPTLQRQRSLLRRRLLPEPQHERRTATDTTAATTTAVHGARGRHQPTPHAHLQPHPFPPSQLHCFPQRHGESR